MLGWHKGAWNCSGYWWQPLPDLCEGSPHCQLSSSQYGAPARSSGWGALLHQRAQCHLGSLAVWSSAGFGKNNLQDLDYLGLGSRVAGWKGIESARKHAGWKPKHAGRFQPEAQKVRVAATLHIYDCAHEAYKRRPGNKGLSDCRQFAVVNEIKGVRRCYGSGASLSSLSLLDAGCKRPAAWRPSGCPDYYPILHRAESAGSLTIWPAAR